MGSLSVNLADNRNNLADSMSAPLLTCIILVGDNANNYFDSLTEKVKLSIAVLLGDTLRFADEFKAKYTYSTNLGELLSILDGIETSLDPKSSTLADSLSLGDGIQINLSQGIYLSLEDTISLSDSLSKFLGSSDLIYLRKYLNDVAR